ncbi:MAG: hypothetical protein QMC90_01460 [Dehalococcoidales bacterium]|nr:hypothetical protein [Dehalococcoidales bacterium]
MRFSDFWKPIFEPDGNIVFIEKGKRKFGQTDKGTSAPTVWRMEETSKWDRRE